MAMTVLDLAGREISFEESPVSSSPPSPDDVVALVRGEAARLADDGIDLLGVTVAVPGLIDRARGRVVDAPNLGWIDVDLADVVRHAAG